MEHQWIAPLVLQAALIVLNMFFVCIETSLHNVNITRMEQLSSQGDKRAARLIRLLAQPAKMRIVVRAMVLLTGIFGGAFAAESLATPLSLGLTALGIPFLMDTSRILSITLVVLAWCCLLLLFAELTGAKLAARKAESITLSTAGLLRFLTVFLTPLIFVLTLLSNGLLRLMGIDSNDPDNHISEEEIRTLADAGSRRGVIDREENEIIQNLFEFDDLPVGEFATHRTDISLLWMDETLAQWEKTIHESRHTMYPVCDETVDNVLGVLNVKDYFRLKGKTKEYIVGHAVKPAQFIPESVRADVLFRRMKASRNHFAVVLDEYGGMVGIVTMNDLLEQLVGDLEDDLTGMEEDPKMEQLDPVTWRVDGGVDLEDASKRLGIELPTEDYDTFGGFVFGVYGSIPSDGTRFELDTHGLHVKVISIKEHRLERAIVCKADMESDKEEQD